MKLNKFILVGAIAGMTALGITNAHAEDNHYGQQQEATQQASITQEDVGNFFKNVWGKTKEVANTVGDKAVDISKTAGQTVGEGMQKAGKGLQEISQKEDAKPAQVENKSNKTAKAEKTNKNQKTEVKTEPKVEKAEAGILNDPQVKELNKHVDDISNNAVKIKDNVVGSIGGFLDKLRASQNNTNENAPKP